MQNNDLKLESKSISYIFCPKKIIKTINMVKESKRKEIESPIYSKNKKMK